MHHHARQNIGKQETTMVQAIPEGYHTVTPSLTYKDTRKAIAFYQKAFGAVERWVMPTPDGKNVSHAEIQIGDSFVMMCDENPNRGCKSAEAMSGSPVTFYLYVKDVDAAFKKAVEAGATVTMPVMDMFWGDRAGVVTDPFGYCWMFATHTKDLSPEEIKKAAAAFYAQQK
jgi:PhnB protein